VNITLPQSKFFLRTILCLNCRDFKFSVTVVTNSKQHSRLRFSDVYDFVRQMHYVNHLTTQNTHYK